MAHKLFANDLRFKHINTLLDNGPTVWHEGVIPDSDMPYHLDDDVILLNKDRLVPYFEHRQFRIASCAYFHSVRDALERIGIEQLLPELTSIDEAMSFYLKDGKASENEMQYGFVVLGLIHPTHDARYNRTPISENELRWMP